MICQETGVAIHTHGVPIDCSEGMHYSTHCIQKLREEEFDQITVILMTNFSQDLPPANSVMSWSLAAEAAGFVVGTIYSARGGPSGLRIEPMKFLRGIFRCP